MLFDFVVLVASLSAWSVGVLQRCCVVPLLYTRAFLVQDVSQALSFAIEGLLAVVALSLGHDAAHWQVLHFISLHLHVDPFLFRVSVQNEG